MDAMEKGPALAKPVAVVDDDDDDEEEEEDSESDEDEDDAELERYEYTQGVGRFGRNNGISSGSKAGFGLVGNGVGASGGGGGGVRIKIPYGVSVAKPRTGLRSIRYGKYDDVVPSGGSNMGSVGMRDGIGGYWKGSGGGGGGGGARGAGGHGGSGLGKREQEGGDAVAEMVQAINMLADGFVKTEQRKMDMAREIEMMWMDMETKRLKMVLESQGQVMEAFTKAASEKKKSKRMSSPE